jgi:hypothetical protein
MVAEAVPVLAIFTVCVAVVFRAELPKVRLDGVAVMIALPGVCGGAGVGVGEAEGEVPPVDAESAPLLPQPMLININMPNVTMNRKRESCCAVVCCFKALLLLFVLRAFALAWGP